MPSKSACALGRFPELSKPIRRKLAVSDGVLDVLVAEIVLQQVNRPQGIKT
jgi:hypothetical protein